MKLAGTGKSTFIREVTALMDEPDTYGRRIASSALWSLLGEILSKGLMFLSWIVVARILGKEGFGEFGIIRTTITMFAIFGGMGLGLTANKYVSENRNNNKLYSGQIIGFTQIFAISSGLLIGIIVFLGSNYLSMNMLKAPQLNIELKIAAIMLFFSAINGAQIGTLQGLEAYRRLALVNFWQGITALPFFIVGTYFWGLFGSIVAYASIIIVYTVILQLAIKSELKKQDIFVSYHGFADIFPVLWKFIIPAALTGIAVSPFKWLCEALLAKHCGFKELGIFQASIVVTSSIIAVTSTLNAPLISISANTENYASSNKKQLLTIYGSWYVFLLLAIPFLLFPKILIWFFGDKFNDPDLFNTNLLLLLYCGMLMYYQGIMRVMTLNNFLWFAIFTNIFEGLTLIAAFFYFMDLGTIGLGYAYVLSYIVRILVSFPFLCKRKIIPLPVLFNKYFIITMLAFFSVIVVLLSNGGIILR